VGTFSLGAGSLGFVRLARAQEATEAAPAMQPMVSAFYRYPMGDAMLTVIQDGFSAIEPQFLAVNAPEEALALAQESNLPIPFNSTFNVTLVENGDRRIIIDTGLGAAMAMPGFSGGNLIPTLEALGLSAADITDVVISHFHPDHIGGALAQEGLMFPNAMHHFPQPEQDFLANAPADNEQLAPLIQMANAMLMPAQEGDQLTLYNAEAEVVPGVQAVAAPGHTPGHMAFLVSGGDKSLMLTIDTANHAVLAVQHPEWHMAFDAIPDLAVETRRAILGRAADEKLQVLGYHFPFPGIGVIVREGEGFRYIPTN
jgi:glyoxylase-like metal-dependent hydrolase (beta-lactamase superfamily II)